MLGGYLNLQFLPQTRGLNKVPFCETPLSFLLAMANHEKGWFSQEGTSLPPFSQAEREKEGISQEVVPLSFSWLWLKGKRSFLGGPPILPHAKHAKLILVCVHPSSSELLISCSILNQLESLTLRGELCRMHCNTLVLKLLWYGSMWQDQSSQGKSSQAKKIRNKVFLTMGWLASPPITLNSMTVNTSQIQPHT